MGTYRTGKTVATEYKQGAVYCTQMGDDRWSVYTLPNGAGRELSSGHETLRSARKWCERNGFK